MHEDYKAAHASFEDRNKSVLDWAHSFLKKDIALMDEHIRIWTVQFRAIVGVLEAQPARFDVGRLKRKGDQLRAPDLNSWKGDKLKDGK